MATRPAKRKAGSTALKKAAPKKAESKSPFKLKRSSNPAAKQEGEVLTPPPKVAEAVDAFREALDQAKYYEGEATVHKNTILDFAAEQLAKRQFAGESGGFKIQGIETMAMYVVQDASAGLSEEDIEAFAARWGEKAADELVTRDFASVRFNDSVLEANYDAVVKALSTLPAEVLDNLFKPMSMKARPGAAEVARRHVQSAAELREIMRHLKLKHYVR